MPFVMFLAMQADQTMPVGMACDLWCESTGTTVASFRGLIKPAHGEAISKAAERRFRVTDEDARRDGFDALTALLVAVGMASKAYRVTGFDLAQSREAVSASIGALIERNQRNTKLQDLARTWVQPGRQWLDLSELGHCDMGASETGLRDVILEVTATYTGLLADGRLERADGKPSLAPVPDGDDEWIQAGMAADAALAKVMRERSAA